MNSTKIVDEPIVEDSGTFDVTEKPYLTDVTPRHILCFAKWILAILAIIFMIAAIMEFLHPGNAVFEACKVTLPSLATLVIGYYFGTTRCC